MGLKQGSISKRLMVSLPIFILAFIVMLMPYDALWRYFAWCNQVLAVFTLWTLTVWLARNRRTYMVTLIPALFMTMVTVTYICYAPEGLGIITDAIFGLRISYDLSLLVGAGVSALLLTLFGRSLRGLKPGLSPA